MPILFLHLTFWLLLVGASELRLEDLALLFLLFLALWAPTTELDLELSVSLLVALSELEVDSVSELEEELDEELDDSTFLFFFLREAFFLGADLELFFFFCLGADTAIRGKKKTRLRIDFNVEA